MCIECLGILIIIIKIILDGLFYWIEKKTAKMTENMETIGFNQDSDIPTPLTQDEDLIQSTVYIDRDISYYLEAEICDTTIEFAYEFDGKLFKNTSVDEEYVQFEVHAAKVCNMLSSDDSDVDSTMASDEFSDDDDVELEYSTEIVDQGVIVNSIVFIPDNNWQTIHSIDDTISKCGVCDIYTSLDTINEHIESFSHSLYLNRHKPLKKFDLNIIRKIQILNMYHCGQCNEIFPLQEIDQHFSSQNHKKSLMLSINKAAMILNNNETNNNISVDDDDDDINSFKGASYASIAKKPKPMEMPKYLIKDLATKKIKILFDSWHMLTVTKANTLHCMACNKSEHIRYKSQHCNNVEHIENLMKCTVVEDYKNHLVRQVNNFDSLYHCGHCNNMHYKSEMECHLSIMHPKKKAKERHISANSSSSCENMSPTYSAITNEYALSNDKNAQANDKNVQENDKNAQRNDKNTQANDKNAQENDKSAPSNGKAANMPETDEMVICPFGYKVTISVLSYNMILSNYNHYCCLCGKLLNRNEISLHIRELMHIQLLQTTPYISFYGINLIRSLREILHCTICNALIPIVNIFVHNAEHSHRLLLAESLKIPLSKLPSFAVPPQLAATNGHQFHAPFQGLQAPQMLPYRPQIIGMPNPGQNFRYIQQNNGYRQPFMRPFSPLEANRAQNPIIRPKSAPISETNGAGYFNLGDNMGNNENNVLGANKSQIEPNITEQKSKALGASECQTVDIAPSETNDDLDESMDSVEVYNTEEHVYLKLRNIYFRITLSSYNTLVHVGDGTRYCFICACNVGSDLKKHVDSRSHLENIDKYNFVDKYEKHLLRQAYLTYHCCICNVILTQKELKKHIEWPKHTQEMQIVKSTAKKTRRKDIESGIKQFTIKTVKDQIFLNINVPKVKILANIKISNVEDTESQTLGKNKIINFKDKILKISFANWHGIRQRTKENICKCIVCDMKIEEKDVMVHVELEDHTNNLDKSFDEKYFPALIRPVNDAKSNCIFCNVELLSSHINVHLRGGRHKKMFEAILKESALTNTYEDCDGDMVTV